MRITLLVFLGLANRQLGQNLKKIGFAVIDIDAVEGLCHWKHKETGEKAIYNTGVGKDWLEAHEWICDFAKLNKLLDEEEQNVVVVGIASNQENHFNSFDKVFLLYCNEETFIKRLNTRNEGNNFAKDESEQQQILSWYKDFQNRMIELGAIPINTDKPIEIVVNEIKSKMGTLE